MVNQDDPECATTLKTAAAGQTAACRILAIALKRMQADGILMSLVCVLSFMPLAAMADIIVSQKISAGGGDPQYGFGRALAADGGIVILGDTQRDVTGASDVGVVEFFEEATTGQGYEFDQENLPETLQEFQQYGFAVGIDGSERWAAVGAPSHDTASGGGNTGTVFMLEEDDSGTWTERTRLTPSQELSQAKFGHSLSMEADELVVGAPGWLSSQGLVHVFKKLLPPCSTCWLLDGPALRPPDPQNGDNFGAAVDFSKACGRIVVAAPDRDFIGAVYAYRYNLDGNDTWDLEEVVSSPIQLPGAKFGGGTNGEESVAVTCDHLAVAQTISGKVFVFQTSDWALDAELTELGSVSSGSYGNSIDLSGDRLVIADPRRDTGRNSEGVVHYYRRVAANDWQLMATFAAPDGSGLIEFGASVTIADGHMLWIVAPGEDAVYFVDLDAVATAVPLVGPAGLAVLFVLLAATGSVFAMRRRSV